MKKILSLILALTSVFLLAACTGSTSTVCENHIDANGDFTCDTCSAMYICQNHVDANADTYCDTCTAPYTCPGHADANNDGKCDVCLGAYTCPGHSDVNADGRCDVCLYEFICQHTDTDSNGVCDKCQARFTCPSHFDVNADGKCDSCGQEFECIDHRDKDGNSICDICGESYTCPGHIDANKDDKCDRCGAFGSALTDVKPDSIAAFIRASMNSEPTKVTTNTVYVIGAGSSNCTLNISSVLVSGTVDGSIAAIYTEEYPTFNYVDQGSGNIVIDVLTNNTHKKEFLQGSGVRETVNGVVQKVNGTDEWGIGKNFAPSKGEIALGITATNINVSEFVIEENLHEMHFVVPKAKVNEVFGKTGAVSNVDAAGDVEVILTSNGAVITSLQFTYKIAGSTKDGIPDQTVTTVVEYSYSVQSITIAK